MAHLHPWRLRLRQRDHQLEHEQRRLPYLFKLRHTAKVKELVIRMMRQGALWQDCGDGWQALETTISQSRTRRWNVRNCFSSTSPGGTPGIQTNRLL